MMVCLNGVAQEGHLVLNYWNSSHAYMVKIMVVSTKQQSKHIGTSLSYTGMLTRPYPRDRDPRLDP